MTDQLEPYRAVGQRTYDEMVAKASQRHPWANAAHDPETVSRLGAQLQQYVPPEPDHFVWHDVERMVRERERDLLYDATPCAVLYHRPEVYAVMREEPSPPSAWVRFKWRLGL